MIFKQTIAERDGQIDDFKQTIAERDGQIDALTASNEQTLNRLSQEMASLTIAQESLLYDIARSFRMLTAPVRLTKQFVRDVFNPLTAYRTMRDIHAIKRSGLFDTRYYLANNADVRLSSCDPIRHYIDHGWKEGRNPSSLFNTSYYLNQNPDVRATGINPLVHYVKSGRKEGRRPCNNALQENNVLQESDLNGSFALIHRVAGKIKKKNENTLATNSPVNDGYFKFLFEQTKKLSDIESFVPYKKHRSVETDLKLIAFYLPQFHPVQENDANWEKGFTEWTNVTKAVPQFLGHYQPQLPIDLGFYDLRLVENLKRQIDLAKNYGLHGFCFHHYWFDGKGLMRTPVDNFLAHKELDFRFCLNWANENWTKRWDGQDQEILLRQRHTPEDDIAFIKDTEKYLRDPRYIRIDGKPLLIVYRPTLLPDPKATAERWRRHCRDVGIGELFLATTHSHNQNDPRQIGFDAEIEFAPNCFHLESIAKSLQLMNKAFVGDVASYDSVVAYAKAFSAPEYRRYRGVCPSWDNEPRRPGRGYIIYGSDPAKYREWLKYICEYTQENYPKNERFIFINAWNELAEGAHMEPDRKFGYGYLEATASVLEEYDRSRQRNIVVVSHDAYEFGAQLLAFNIVKTLAKHFNIRVVTILMGGGELQPSFEAYSEVIEWYRLTAKQKKECVSSLWARGFSKAICNTSVVGEVVGYLKDQEFTVTALIHELKNIMLAKNLLPSAQIIAQRADTIVCAAPVVADNFASVTNMDKKDILIRPQGIYYKNEFCKESARHEIVTRYDLPKDALIVLNIGYGDHRKGLDLFLAIGKEVLKHNENSYFIWVGKIAPEMQEMFRAQLDEGNNHFIFPGFIKDIGAFYCAADVFLLTSREDPFPFVVLDALQSGLPVIGFNGAGGFCDLIESGGGILVTYEDINAASRAVIGAEF